MNIVSLKTETNKTVTSKHCQRFTGGGILNNPRRALFALKQTKTDNEQQILLVNRVKDSQTDSNSYHMSYFYNTECTLINSLKLPNRWL